MSGEARRLLNRDLPGSCVLGPPGLARWGFVCGRLTACVFARAGQGLRDTAHRVVYVWPRGCIWLGVADPVTVWGSLCVSLCVMVCGVPRVCGVCLCVLA